MQNNPTGRRLGVPTLLAAAVALVVGLVLGGLGPRSEARALQKRVDELEDRDCGKTGREIASIFRGRPWEAEHPEAFDDASASKSPPTPGRTHRTKRGDRVIEVRIDEEGSETTEFPADENLSSDERLDMLRDGIELRRTQARAALLEGARPSDDQVTDIDVAMDDMNRELRALAEEFVASIEEGQEPSRRDMMSFAADTLDAFVQAEDRVTDTLTDEQLQRLDPEALDPMSHIDPALIDLFYQLDQPR